MQTTQATVTIDPFGNSDRCGHSKGKVFGPRGKEFCLLCFERQLLSDDLHIRKSYYVGNLHDALRGAIESGTDRTEWKRLFEEEHLRHLARILLDFLAMVNEEPLSDQAKELLFTVLDAVSIKSKDQDAVEQWLLKRTWMLLQTHAADQARLPFNVLTGIANTLIQILGAKDASAVVFATQALSNRRFLASLLDDLSMQASSPVATEAKLVLMHGISSRHLHFPGASLIKAWLMDNHQIALEALFMCNLKLPTASLKLQCTDLCLLLIDAHDANGAHPAGRVADSWSEPHSLLEQGSQNTKLILGAIKDCLLSSNEQLMLNGSRLAQWAHQRYPDAARHALYDSSFLDHASDHLRNKLVAILQGTHSENLREGNNHALLQLVRLSCDGPRIQLQSLERALCMSCVWLEHCAFKLNDVRMQELLFDTAMVCLRRFGNDVALSEKTIACVFKMIRAAMGGIQHLIYTQSSYTHCRALALILKMVACNLLSTVLLDCNPGTPQFFMHAVDVILMNCWRLYTLLEPKVAEAKGDAASTDFVNGAIEIALQLIAYMHQFALVLRNRDQLDVGAFEACMHQFYCGMETVILPLCLIIMKEDAVPLSLYESFLALISQMCKVSEHLENPAHLTALYEKLIACNLISRLLEHNYGPRAGMDLREKTAKLIEQIITLVSGASCSFPILSEGASCAMDSPLTSLLQCCTRGMPTIASTENVVGLLITTSTVLYHSDNIEEKGTIGYAIHEMLANGNLSAHPQILPYCISILGFVQEFSWPRLSTLLTNNNTMMDIVEEPALCMAFMTSMSAMGMLSAAIQAFGAPEANMGGFALRIVSTAGSNLDGQFQRVLTICCEHDLYEMARTFVEHVATIAGMQEEEGVAGVMLQCFYRIMANLAEPWESVCDAVVLSTLKIVQSEHLESSRTVLKTLAIPISSGSDDVFLCQAKQWKDLLLGIEEVLAGMISGDTYPLGRPKELFAIDDGLFSDASIGLMTVETGNLIEVASPTNAVPATPATKNNSSAQHKRNRKGESTVNVTGEKRAKSLGAFAEELEARSHDINALQCTGEATDPTLLTSKDRADLESRQVHLSAAIYECDNGNEKDAGSDGKAQSVDRNGIAAAAIAETNENGKTDSSSNEGDIIEERRDPSIGIRYHKKSQRWEAWIRIQGKKKYVGCYQAEVVAAHVYDLVALEMFGKDADTNFHISKYANILEGRKKEDLDAVMHRRILVRFASKCTERKWGMWYAGTVDKLRAPKFHVTFDDGDADWINPENKEERYIFISDYDKGSVDDNGSDAEAQSVERNGVDGSIVVSGDDTHNDNGCKPFKGIRYHKKSQRWEAWIRIQGKQKYIGCYHNEIDASVVYDLVALEMFGKDADTNFHISKYANILEGRKKEDLDAIMDRRVLVRFVSEDSGDAWSKRGVWYAGTVDKLRAPKFHVTFDDGDADWINPENKEERYVFLSAAGPEMLPEKEKADNSDDPKELIADLVGTECVVGTEDDDAAPELLAPPQRAPALVTPEPKKGKKAKTSQYTGVSLLPSGKWRARASYYDSEGKRQVKEALFESEVAAARAYDAFVLELRGEHAVTNFPRGDVGWVNVGAPTICIPTAAEQVGDDASDAGESDSDESIVELMGLDCLAGIDDDEDVGVILESGVAPSCVPMKRKYRARKYRAGCSSKFRGVSFNKRSGKWQAQLSRNNKYVGGSYHVHELEAAKAYDVLALTHLQENAVTNFPACMYRAELEDLGISFPAMFGDPNARRDGDACGGFNQTAGAATKGSSRFKGVTYIKSTGKWRVRASIPGPDGKKKLKQFGVFFDEVEAAKKFDLVVLEHYGEEAITNFQPILYRAELEQLGVFLPEFMYAPDYNGAPPAPPSPPHQPLLPAPATQAPSPTPAPAHDDEEMIAPEPAPRTMRTLPFPFKELAVLWTCFVQKLESAGDEQSAQFLRGVLARPGSALQHCLQMATEDVIRQSSEMLVAVPLLVSCLPYVSEASPFMETFPFKCVVHSIVSQTTANPFKPMGAMEVPLVTILSTLLQQWSVKYAHDHAAAPDGDESAGLGMAALEPLGQFLTAVLHRRIIDCPRLVEKAEALEALSSVLSCAAIQWPVRHRLAFFPWNRDVLLYAISVYESLGKPGGHTYPPVEALIFKKQLVLTLEYVKAWRPEPLWFAEIDIPKPDWEDPVHPLRLERPIPWTRRDTDTTGKTTPCSSPGERALSSSHPLSRLPLGRILSCGRQML